MYKLLLVVLAMLAAASAQFLSPYYGYGGVYRNGYYGGYGAPYAYGRTLGYGYGGYVYG